MQLHCIVDNLSAHFTPKVEAFLDDHPRIFLHNTPTHASWLNQVELFLLILERRLLRNGEFDSVEDLAQRIIAFINNYNRRALPLDLRRPPPEGHVSHNDFRARSLVLAAGSSTPEGSAASAIAAVIVGGATAAGFSAFAAVAG